MNKVLLYIGIVILVIGLILVVAFWPLTAVRGRDLSREDYEIGDTVKFYGTITSIDYIELLGVERIEIDGELEIYNAEERTDRKEGDVVYGEVRYSQELFGILNFWRLQGELNLKRNIDMIFYGISIAGVAVSAAGYSKI